MRTLKDSGVEWIGSMPMDWGLNQAGQYLTQIKNKNVGMIETNLLSLSYGRVKRRDIEARGGLLPESFEGYTIVEDGDIVLRFTDLQNDQRSLRTGLVTERGIITSAYTTVRPNNTNMARYLHYALHAFDIRKGFYGMGSGVRQGLRWQEAKYILLPIPDEDEQQRIADYLDKEYEEIDTAIRAAEASIEGYERLRDAIILDAVTQGVSRHNECRPSRVTWTDTFPISWEPRKIKYVLHERNESNSDLELDTVLSLSARYGVTLYSERVGGGNKAKASLEDYKKARAGDIVLNSMNIVSGSVGISPYDGCVSPVYYMFYLDDGEGDIRFFNYVFQTDRFQKSLFGLGNGIMVKESSTGKLNTVRMRISPSVLKSQFVPVPPIEEQSVIADYLDQRCSAIAQLISVKESIIEDLRYYKQSLVYEVVTGKRKV